MQSSWEYEMVGRNAFWYLSLIVLGVVMSCMAIGGDMLFDYLVNVNHPELFMGEV